jgi:hypothetical protein
MAILEAMSEATESHPENIDGAFKHLLDLAEIELCGICDEVLPDGSANEKYLGRSGGLKTQWGAVVPRSAGQVGRSDGVTLGLVWLSVRFGELAGLITAQSKGRPRSEAKDSRWQGITKKLRKPGGVLKCLLDHEKESGGEQWLWKVRSAGHLTDECSFAAASLRTWAKEAREAAATRSKGASKVASKSWWKWVDEQLRVGAGGLHRLTKREEIAADSVVEGPGGPSLSLQQTLDSDREAWSEIWTTFSKEASAPWRGLQGDWEDDFPWSAPLPEITGEDLVSAAKKFKKLTAIGSDAFRPLWITWLSPALLSGFAKLFMALERVGVWPAQVQQILVALIPKADGGRRPIGLLPTLVRIWERVRKPAVASWRCSVTRSYNWAAKGRSPQAAVWRLALQDEAAAARGEESAASLLDLVKAFELVRLELVWRCGLRLHFPVRILRLMLQAFAFARSLVMNGAISAAVMTLSAILAGGGFATDALFLVLVGPCDEINFGASESEPLLICGRFDGPRDWLGSGGRGGLEISGGWLH